MHRGITARRAEATGPVFVPGRATLAILVIVTLFGLPFTARAKGQSIGAVPPSEGAMEVYRALDAWVRSMDLPDEPAAIDPAGTTGACVTLRLSGVVVGRGTRMGADGRSAWRAAVEAWSEALPKLSPGSGGVRDAAALEDARDSAQRVTIDLQLAGALVPMPERSLEELSVEISPGLDGVCARVGERSEAVFPGTMLATNMHTGAALVATINALGLERVGVGDPRVSLNALRKDRGLTIYRFGVQHLAQCTAGGAPVFLHRGGRVVGASELNPAALSALEEGMIAHLASRLWPGEEPFGLLGVYEPWTGTYEGSRPGDPAAQGLAALALLRSATVRAGSPDVARRRLELAWRVLADLGEVGEGEADPRAGGAALTLLVACGELLEDAERTIGAERVAEWNAPLRARAWRACSLDDEANARFRAMCSPDGFDAALAPGERALVAYALACSATGASKHGLRVERGLAASAVRRLMRETGPGDLANLMPWIGLAEVRLAGADAAVPSAVALRQLRELVQRHTLHALDLGQRDRDLQGGLVFTRGRAPLPSWHTLRPLAFTAFMLGDDRLTSREESPAEFSRLLPSLRFLAQLTVGEAEMHMFRSRDRAIGGVRLSLWDQRMPLEPTAMGLLTLSETLDAMRRRS